MTTFAIITEGVSDQPVIENILEGMFPEPEINILQPLRDATDKQANQAGWEFVFEYLGSSKLGKAFQTNDYVVVQIDTDVSEAPNFNVPQEGPNGKLTPKELVDQVALRLLSILESHHEANHTLYRERMLFAIAVHSIECWLLPLYAKTEKKQGHLKNCHKLLERETQSKVHKNYRAYEELSKPFRKGKKLMAASKCNPSLGIFVQALADAPIT